MRIVSRAHPDWPHHTFTLRRDEISGEIDGYDFEGPTRFDKLFAGVIFGTAVERPKNLDPNDLTGTEDIGPEDTGGGDYGRLLDRVYALGATSPTGSAREWQVPVPGEVPAAGKAA